MPTLLLAVEIADVISKACNDQRPVDVEATADKLVDAHPGSATRDEVIVALSEEKRAAGLTDPD